MLILMILLKIIGGTVFGFIVYKIFYNPPLSSEFKSSILAETTPEDFANKYKDNGSYLQGGTLCFYGFWFGKPFDNFHKLVNTDYDKIEDTLCLTFNEKEKLTIYNPKIIEEYPNRIIIQEANRIKWQWFLYGKEQTVNNLHFIDINRFDNKLEGKTSITSHQENFETLDITKPAVLWTD